LHNISVSVNINTTGADFKLDGRNLTSVYTRVGSY
jgi:hypothetical protein